MLHPGDTPLPPGSAGQFIVPITSTTGTSAVPGFLEHGLSGRSARTIQPYRDGVKPLTDRLGRQSLHKLSAADVRSTLGELSAHLSMRSLQIALA